MSQQRDYFEPFHNPDRYQGAGPTANRHHNRGVSRVRAFPRIPIDFVKIPSILLLIVLCITPMSKLQAHDAGLSRARVQIHDSGVAIHLTFAQSDIEMLVPIDKDHDGTVAADEFAAAREALRTILSTAVKVQQVGQELLPQSIRIDQVSNDSVNIAMGFDAQGASPIHLHIPLIAQLARGHRQHLTILDADGELREQHLLDATASPVLLAGSGLNLLSVFREYLVQGIWHIWLGFDHILFLLTLSLPAVLAYQRSQWQSQQELRPAITDILKIVTAFTVAHSITLALAVFGIVALPPRLVESAIAFSVLITALNNLRPIIPVSRWLLAFTFGLVHGFGFASVLMDIGLPRNTLALSLVGFNLGVEAGQLAMVMLVFPAIAFLRHTPVYRVWVFRGGSALAVLIATIWMFERIFDYEITGL